MQTDLLPDFLHLLHSFGSNNRNLKNLLKLFAGDARRIRQSKPSELLAAGISQAGISRIKSSHSDEVKTDLDWITLPDNHLVTIDNPAYPALLRQIPDYPLALYASGNLDLLSSPQVAIVGSRKCTPSGAQNAFEFSSQLASSQLTITSGLAIGIDGQAHRGALSANGNTIAVCATGLDITYPRQHQKLATEIRQRGLVVSEFPPGTKPLPAYFPQRNRIISGLAMATLVIEAAERSGSLITARLAGEQGREVFALPGSIHNPQTRGCHQLIRDGARLTESPGEITHELSNLLNYVFDQAPKQPLKATPELGSGPMQLLNLIGYDPVNPDTIVTRSGLTSDKVSSMLLLLELNDLIHSAPGGCYVRI